MDTSRNDPNSLKSRRNAFFGSIGESKQISDQAHLQQPQNPIQSQNQKQNKPKHEIVSPIKDRAGNAANLNIGLNQTEY
jgi:hypothetical protein